MKPPLDADNRPHIFDDYMHFIQCPTCDADMRLVHGRYGWFFGCVKYPACKGTRSQQSAEWAVRSGLGVDWDYLDEHDYEEPH